MLNITTNFHSLMSTSGNISSSKPGNGTIHYEYFPLYLGAYISEIFVFMSIIYKYPDLTVHRYFWLERGNMEWIDSLGKRWKSGSSVIE